ncbi:Uncharacterised protein [Vibrio cholerae]|nr:Uncharacterised protein [Vibrio cholerae]CSA68033.1 Uncharacterised protein [Vibrio cholerae]CSC27681.1 Uncharacterised protein [Vibrio cholerae]CSC36457.1 Uncharacterised protein [Vibrio cholerae]CSI04077.1 Uncharacterised protein [Vibrio cholerae]
MIRDNAQRLISQILVTNCVCGCFDQRLEYVDFVVGVHALHDRGNTLNTHARVHRRLR